MTKIKHKRNAKHTKINAEEEERKTMLTDEERKKRGSTVNGGST